MTTGRKILGVLAVLVSLFYVLESFLSFQANGFTPPLLVKIGIVVAAAWYAWRTFRAAGPAASGNEDVA